MSFKRFKVEKLIRDRLPTIMRSKGIFVNERKMEHIEFIERLKEKLLEEAKEVKGSKSHEELKEELADTLEVIYTLCEAADIPLEHIEKMRLEKRKKKGGFDHKVYISHVDIEEKNPAINYYLERQQNYPLIEN